MEDRRTLGIAVIGQGFMGRAHSLAWSRAAQMPDTALRPKLVVLGGRDPAALEANATRFGFGAWSEHWRDVIARDDVDVVDVCTPGALHAQVALAALEAGKHVLVEKPLANTVDEAQALASAAERAGASGRFGMVGFNYRRVPALALARRLIADNRIGAIRHFRAAYLQDWLVDSSFPMTWRLDRTQAGSGALGDLGAHIVDLAHFLTDDQIVEVAGTLETFITERPVPGSPGRTGTVDVDDACMAVARLSHGATAIFEATRMAPGRKNSLTIEINGSVGSLRFDLERLNELQLYETGGRSDGFQTLLVTNDTDPYIAQWWPPGHTLGWDHSFVHQCQDFLAAIANGRQPRPSITDGLRVQIALDAISRSASEHRWITLDPVPG